MPRKDEPKDEPVVETAAPSTVTLQDFFYPNVGDGITIRAATQEEANEKAQKIRESLA